MGKHLLDQVEVPKDVFIALVLMPIHELDDTQFGGVMP